MVHEVRIRDLKVTYRDGRTGQSTVISLDSLDARAEGVDMVSIARTVPASFTGT